MKAHLLNVLGRCSFIYSADSIVSAVDGKGVVKSTGNAIVTTNVNEGTSFVTLEATVKVKDNNGKLQLHYK